MMVGCWCCECGFVGGCDVSCVKSRNSEEETTEDRRKKKWQYCSW
jgi:hypothetical protein